MRGWMRYIDEVPTVAVRVPSFANLFAPMRFTNTSDADFQKHTDRLPLRKQFYERMTQKGFGRGDRLCARSDSPDLRADRKGDG